MRYWWKCAAAFAIAAFGLVIVATVLSRSHTTAYLRGDVLDQGAISSRSTRVERLLLIGDAGAAAPESQILAHLASHAREDPERTHILFLGDNLYPVGMARSSCCDERVSALDQQIELLRSGEVRGTFLPGNHDWSGLKRDIDRLDHEAHYIGEHTNGFGSLAPSSEAIASIATDLPLQLIALDTNRWLTMADGTNIQRATTRLQRSLSELSKRGDVLVLGHHPLVTYGQHGGRFSFEDYFAPFPLAKPLWRLAGVNAQDVMSAEYRQMIGALRRAMSPVPPLAYIAGHDHDLQVIQPDRDPFLSLVSGAGSRHTPVWHGRDTLFALESYGYMEIDAFADGSVALRIYASPSQQMEPKRSFSMWLREPHVRMSATRANPAASGTVREPPRL